jgi:SAM-dependent methyltransferase
MTNPFDAMYQGTPPWEIGRPQPAIVRAVDAGLVRGAVLDVGCGTGENAIYAASKGLSVVGLDASPRAISIARRKAQGRKSTVELIVGDAFKLGALGRRFDTVLDCALFHSLTDAARPLYARSLASVMAPGATLLLFCFSDEEPKWGGPRRVTQAELRATFGAPFAVDRIDAAEMDHLHPTSPARAWLAQIVHIGRHVSSGN